MEIFNLRFTVLFIAFLLALNNVFSQDVIPLVPRDGEELTDIAVTFKAKVGTDGPYQLEVCQDSTFSSKVLTQEHSDKQLYDDVYFFTRIGLNKPDQKFSLEPGTWYWRVSDNAGVNWSSTRKLIVNNDYSPKPQAREITTKKPLFHLRLRSQPIASPSTAAAQLQKMVPDDLKEHVVLDLGQSFLYHLTKGRDILEYSRFYNDLGYKFTFDMGAHYLQNRIASLGELEQVFKELPNCVGAATSELFYQYFNAEQARSQFDGTLELCRKYGKFYAHADMNWKWAKWQMFGYLNWEKFSEKNYGDYLIPLYKTTDPWGAFTNVSSIQGMKLTGMVKHIGLWSDEWCWEKFGDVNEFALEYWILDAKNNNGAHVHYPFIQGIKNYIYAMTYGSTVFALEGHQQWSGITGEPNDNHSRYLLPFIRAVVNENLIPSEEAINRNFHAVVNTEYKSVGFDSERISYLEGNVWGDFLRSTYGISDLEPYGKRIKTNQGDIYESAYLEMIPNTDRYPSGIPFLPKPGIDAPVVDGRTMEVINISDLNTKQKVNAKLNAHYPESENQAYARRIDSSIFVFNTIENHDVNQDYAVDIQFAGIDQLYGNVGLMSYVVGRCRNDGKTIFFQANAHVENQSIWGGKYKLPTYPSVLNFKCQKEPILESDEIGAITHTWDSENGIFNVSINHTSAGAVNFTLSGDASVSYIADSVTIVKQDIDVFVHDNAMLSGHIYPETLQGVSITWKSLNPAITSISPKGLITGTGDGTCKIVALAGGQSDTLEVKVTEIKLTEIKINEDAIYLDVGDSVNLSVDLVPDEVSFTSIYWDIKRSSIASVDHNGLVKAKRNGETYVVVTHEASGLTDTCFVYIGKQSTLNRNISDKIKVFPNPANDVLHVKGVNDKSTFTIISLSGTTISHNEQVPLNLQGLKQGTYILKIESTDRVIFKKFIIQ